MALDASPQADAFWPTQAREPQPDIRIRVRTLIVEIQRAEASSRRVVAGAAANREAGNISTHNPFLLLGLRRWRRRVIADPLQPATNHAANFVKVLAPYLVLADGEKAQFVTDADK